MKVCHVTSVHTTFDTRIFHKECKALMQANHDVTLIAQADWDERVVDNVRVIGLPKIRKRYQRMGLWRRIVKEVDRLEPDVVHFHDPELLLIAPFLRPAKTVYDCHEPYAEYTLTKEWIPSYLRYPLSKLVDSMEPFLAQRTDAVVVTANNHVARFQQTGQLTVILHNFPLLEDFGPTKQINNTKTLVHVGEQTRVRGCNVLIETMKLVNEQVKDARLLLVGRFDDQEYKAEIEHLIAAYGLKKSVLLTGEVPYTAVSKWLAQAAVGIIALQEVENFKTAIPTKLFEYMSSRIPIVASDLPPARQFIEPVDCGLLVEPAAPQEYAEAIIYLLNHPAEARRMGENGRRAVEEEYNWATEAQKLVELYQKLG